MFISPDPPPWHKMIAKTVLFLMRHSKFLPICHKLGGSSIKSFSALLLGGVGGVADFKNRKLTIVVKTKGEAVIMFKRGKFCGSSFITAGDRA